MAATMTQAQLQAILGGGGNMTPQAPNAGATAWSPSFGTNAGGQFDFNGASGAPGLATNFYGSKDAAQQAFFSAHPEYSQYQGDLAKAVTFGADGSQTGGGAQPGGADALSQLIQSATQPGYIPTPTTVDPTFYGGTQVGPAAQSAGADGGAAAQFGGAGGGLQAALFGGPTPSAGASSYSAAQQDPASLTAGANMGFGNVDPALLAKLDPSQAMALINQGFAPQAQSQQRQLQQALAEAGVVGGAAVNAETNLGNNQTAALAPALAGAVQSSQGNLLSAANTGSSLLQDTGRFNAGAQNARSQFNTAEQNQASAANAAAATQASIANAQFAEQTGLSNQNARNSLQDMIAGFQQQAGMSNQNATNNMQQFNAGQQQQNNQYNSGQQNNMQQLIANLTQQTGLTNTGYANDASRMNAGSQNATDAANTGIYNNANQNMLQEIMQAYYNQQNAKQGAILGGQGASNQVGVGAANNFQVPTGSGGGVGGLAGALGGIYAPKPTSAPQQQQQPFNTTPVPGVGYQQPPTQPPPQGMT